MIEAPEAAADLLKVQLVAAALLFLIGFVVMVTRRGVAGRPLPVPVKVLVNFFSVAFVMGAVLLLSLALEIPLDAFLTIQRTIPAQIKPCHRLIGCLGRGRWCDI